MKFNPRTVPEPAELTVQSKAAEDQRLRESALCATCGEARKQHKPTAKTLAPGCRFVEAS